MASAVIYTTTSANTEANGKDRCAVMLQGVPGIGKSTATFAYFKQHGTDLSGIPDQMIDAVLAKHGFAWIEQDRPSQGKQWLVVAHRMLNDTTLHTIVNSRNNFNDRDTKFFLQMVSDAVIKLCIIRPQMLVKPSVSTLTMLHSQCFHSILHRKSAHVKSDEANRAVTGFMLSFQREPLFGLADCTHTVQFFKPLAEECEPSTELIALLAEPPKKPFSTHVTDIEPANCMDRLSLPSIVDQIDKVIEKSRTTPPCTPLLPIYYALQLSAETQSMLTAAALALFGGEFPPDTTTYCDHLTGCFNSRFKFAPEVRSSWAAKLGQKTELHITGLIRHEDGRSAFRVEQPELTVQSGHPHITMTIPKGKTPASAVELFTAAHDVITMYSLDLTVPAIYGCCKFNPFVPKQKKSKGTQKGKGKQQKK